jgi:hypothetical protein
MAIELKREKLDISERSVQEEKGNWWARWSGQGDMIYSIEDMQRPSNFDPAQA